MNQQGKRTALRITWVKTLGVALGIALVVGVVDMVRDDGSDETQPRTRIEVASLGPQIGEQVPDFSLPDQNGQVRTLESILGPNGAMLLFHRSADW